MRTVRRVIREKAFQSLFQLATDIDCTVDEVIQFSLGSELEFKEELTAEEAMQKVLPEDKNGTQIINDALVYLNTLVTGVQKNENEIDHTISKHLKNWTLSRLERTNLLILRLAAYELLYQKEIDKRVVMNEAIELTKDFNDEKASKFVNGVLQSIVNTQS
ncbi:transcription antitermination factor NusB [Marinilactibacillus piezotolerans]|uniref:transcription antitermination factor NusB n=1 Tax=Marinilactibacillus piezotolerans TaxID=258723 RepID=UPI0011813EE1|nr:transcription antitermination factor NusB [Marinilactibacillus piezotolerans]